MIKFIEIKQGKNAHFSMDAFHERLFCSLEIVESICVIENIDWMEWQAPWRE